MQRLLIATAIFATACSATVAEEVTEGKLQKITAINYRGLDFSSDQAGLLKALPNAKLNKDHAGSDIGVSTYEIRDDSNIDCVLLRFFDDALVEIQYIYFPVRVARMGGPGPLNALAVSEYGQSTKKIGNKRIWEFPGIDRTIVVSESEGKWSQHDFHRSRLNSLAIYPETSAAPFESKILVTRGLAVPYKAKTVDSVPGSVMQVIVRDVKLDHPGNRSTQDYVVGKQVRAYQEWKNFDCPSKMPPRVFEFLKGKIARDHPADYSTQIYVLKTQLSAYAELANMSTPTGVAGSHYFALRNSAERSHPRDYSTQLFVLKRYINKYLLYREAGNSGESILRYVLRHG